MNARSLDPCLRDLLRLFELPDRKAVHFIGGGGKTTAMLAMAKALESAGRSAVISTSTRIEVPRGIPLLVGRLERLEPELVTHPGPVLAVAASYLEQNTKVRGFLPEELDRLQSLRPGATLLVEADGSAGRPVKAHAEYEPVLAPCADLVVAVVGIESLGKPIGDHTVHRSDLFCRRYGKTPGQVLGVQDLAALFVHPEGYLAKVPERCEVIVLVTGVFDAVRRDRVFALAEVMNRNRPLRPIHRLVMAELLGPLPFAAGVGRAANRVP